MSLPKGHAVKRFMNQDEIMKTPFIVFQSHRDDYTNMASDSTLRGIQQESVLSKVFFHRKNMDLIQKQLISEIFHRTNGEFLLVDYQDEADLETVMRSIFLQHARHYPDHIKEQIQELNNLVVDDLFPNVLSEIKAYFGYRERAFGPMQVLDRPEYMSNAGTKKIPSAIRP